MEFREAFITNKGQELFARAAGNSNTGEEPSAEGIGKIIWGDALTSSLDSKDFTTAHMQGLTLNELKSNNGQSSSGTATSATVTYIPAVNVDDRAVSKVVVECELSNSQYYGYASTFGICAKVDGDSGYVLAVVARCGKDDQDQDIEPSYINQKSSDGVGFVKFTVDFTINFSSGALTSGIADAPDSYYASASNLQKLSERVVTTHSASDNNIGDDQTILGEKTFQDPSVFNNGVTFTNTRDDASRVTFDTNVLITDNGNDGQFECRAAAVFNDNSTFRSRIVVNSDAGICITKYSPPDISKENNDSIKLNCNLTPSTADSFDIGTPTKKWNNIYANNISGTITAAASLTTNPSLSWSDTTVNNPSGTGYLSVTAGGKTSDPVKINTVQNSIQTYARSIPSGSSSVKYHLLCKTSTASVNNFVSLYSTATSLYYDPSNNSLYCNKFNGNLVGNADSATKADTVKVIAGPSEVKHAIPLIRYNGDSQAIGYVNLHEYSHLYAKPTYEGGGREYCTLYCDYFNGTYFTGSSFTGDNFFGTLVGSATESLKDVKLKATHSSSQVVHTDGGYSSVSGYYQAYTRLDIRDGYSSSRDLWGMEYPVDRSTYVPAGGWHDGITSNTITFSEMLRRFIAWTIAGSDEDYRAQYTDIGSIRVLLFKTTVDWGYIEGTYVSGTHLHIARIRTESCDGSTTIRVDASGSVSDGIRVNGVWKALHAFGNVAKNDTFIGLFVRIA